MHGVLRAGPCVHCGAQGGCCLLQAHSLAPASMQPHNLPSAASLASAPRPTQQPQAMDALDRALSDHMEMHAQVGLGAICAVAH